ncbi:hypothetical protein VTK56DRAFT_9164 [Thermocarpiscus australiensis]
MPSTIAPFESSKMITGISWTDSTWMGDLEGDLALDFEGKTWKVKKDIIYAQFNWTSAFRHRPPGSHILVPPVISNGIRPEVFSAVLGFLHTNEFRRRIWEDSPSFLTYVEIYYVAESLGIDKLKASMVKCVEDCSWHVLSLRGADCPLSRAEAEREEEEHLKSFVDAMVSVETHNWSAKIQKAMYDAGERLRDRLMGLPAFREVAESFPAGRGFARAIGMGRL